MPKGANGAHLSSLARKTGGYLPTLDGWRAIAILSVIFYHDRLYSLGPVSTGWIHQYGYYGVDLFFAISGILICWRLVEEEQAFGQIALGKFYIRRAFRILPPSLVFLLTVAVLSLAGVLHISLREWLVTLLFLRNYSSLAGPLSFDSNFLGHFWSLALEEHFYLILPGLLVLTRKRWRLPVLLSLAFLIELHCFFVLKSRLWTHVGFHTDVRLNCLLIPAIFAIIVQSGEAKEQFKRWLRYWPLLLILVAIFITYSNGKLWQITALELLMPLMLLGSILNPGGHLARVLEWRLLRYLGRISYSVYLWQQLFFVGRVYAGTYPLGILERTPLRYAAALVLAMSSYYLVERPLIRLGHKLAPPATPGRGDLLIGTQKDAVASSTTIPETAEGGVADAKDL